MSIRDLQSAQPGDIAQQFVNGQRLNASIAELAEFGGTADGGVSRQALTEIENKARRYLVDKAKRLGCVVEIDSCANLFFRRRGTDDGPPVLTGSHVDTQPVGGKLDGAYGIVAGLEVIEALNDGRVQTKRPIEVVVWTNEEGSRFAPGAMGSSSFVAPDRLQQYLESVDQEGVRFRHALDETLRLFSDVPHREPKTPIAAFIEAHIEQGPVLEMAGVPLGAVTGIQCVRWYRVECSGLAAHAGTTPMHSRRDAMTSAVALAADLYALTSEEEFQSLRLTFGQWTVTPNSINTIPGHVTFSIDARSGSDSVLASFEGELDKLVESHKDREAIRTQCIFSRPPTAFPGDLQDLVVTACVKANGQQPVKLVSGAFHDAMYLAEHCPTSMIFVLSKGGISHNAAEYSSPDDLYAGARALAYVVTTLAMRQ